MAKPGLPGSYGSSWHASYRLGSTQLAVRVSSPRSCRNAAASSTDPPAGVAYVQDGIEVTVQAQAEVLLSGGVINSPQLLMLSGVGTPPASCARLGVERRR